MKMLLNLPNSCFGVGFKNFQKKRENQREPAGRIRPTPAHRPAPASASAPEMGPARGRRCLLSLAPPRPPTPEMGRASSHFARALARPRLLALAASAAAAHRRRDARRRRRDWPPPRPLEPRLRTLELRHHLRHPPARSPSPPSSVRRPIWPSLPHHHGRDSASSRAAASPPPCSLLFSLCARTGAARPRIESSRAQS